MVLFRLLYFFGCDSVITLGEIAYNVIIMLGEVLLAIASTVHNGNIFNRSHFFELFFCKIFTKKCMENRTIPDIVRICPVFHTFLSFVILSLDPYRL